MRMTPPTAEGRIEVQPCPGWGFVSASFNVVDLCAHFNNDGISHAGNIPDGDLNGEGMAFPAHELPAAKQVVEMCGVPFLFPDKDSGADNNVCLEGQVIEVPPDSYTRLYVLGVSEGGSFEETLGLRYLDGVLVPVLLGLTTCRPPWGRTQYGEDAAVRFRQMHYPPGEMHVCSDGDNCGLWIQTIDIESPDQLLALELGDNCAMHVFAMTLRCVWVSCEGSDG